MSVLLAKMKQHFLSLDMPLPAMPMITNTRAATWFDDSFLPPGSSGPEITCWFLDTRNLWPGNNIWSATGAAAALSLISLPEQNVVTTKMFIADARMSLGSALLKRCFVSKTLGIPWKDVRFGRKGDSKHGKPVAEIGRAHV